MAQCSGTFLRYRLLKKHMVLTSILFWFDTIVDCITALHLKLYARRALYLKLSASLGYMQVDSDNRYLFECYMVEIISKKCPLSKQTIENGLPPIAGSHFPPIELGPRRREKTNFVSTITM